MSEQALSADRIRDLMQDGALACLRELSVLQAVDSTNAELARLPAERRHAHAVLADTQTGGRGRRQRRWHSPPGGNIYLSLGWRFDEDAPPLSTLPLVAGICLSRALHRTGLRGYGIKWPNDILVGGAKLAGILVETQSAGSGPVHAVIGIGLNVRMPGEGDPAAVIDRPWTDLASQLPAELRGVDRNDVAALVLDELLPGLERFERNGFGPFRAEWERQDLLAGRRVRLESNGDFTTGTAQGVDDDGGLLVDLDGYGMQAFHAAEVSVFDA